MKALVSTAGKPAAIAAFSHISALRTVRHHLVELRVTQAIPASARQAFVLDKRRLVRLGFGGLDDEPVLSRLAWPIAGLRLVAMTMREEARRQLAGLW